jgi:hypothetical protein
MKNNFDLKGYMKSNQVGSYQQLNEMWYQDINQALGDFNEAVVIDSLNEEDTVEETEEMEEGKKQLAFVVPTPDVYDIDDEAKYFQRMLDKAGVKAKVKANHVGEELEIYTKDEKKARKVIEKNGYQIGWTEDNDTSVENTKEGEKLEKIITKIMKSRIDPEIVDEYISTIYQGKIPKNKKIDALGGIMIKDLINTLLDKDFESDDIDDFIHEVMTNSQDYELEEKGDVKSIGDAGKMAHANTRTNLARHRSSDMLDKMSKKDHDKNTVTGAKAAAYKAPHMKEEETADDIFAGSDKANWDNYGNETSEWDTEIAGQTVNGWTAEETQGGAIAWQNPKYPNAHIYATPGWEGVDGIAFELHDSEDGYMDEPKIQKVIGSGTEAWKTKEGYMALMAKAFTVVEKMLIPSDNMDEDHGTQVNHDMNDDISMDYTEPEHMVQNEGVQDWNHTWEEDIADLLDDGVSKPEILTHFKDILKNADSRMEESIEDEDPFGSIKTGIDKITQDDDEDFIDDDKLDRFYDMGGRQLTKAADALLDDGFSKREIIDYLQNYM